MTQEAKKNLGGRPSIYSEELADRICELLGQGKSLRRICLMDDMPDRSTVNKWIDYVDGFAAKYARAREEQAEYHHDEMDEIEEEVRNGTLDPKAANVILGNKRWRMEKLKPKATAKKPWGYGQKLELSGDEASPLTIQIVKYDDDPPTS